MCGRLYLRDVCPSCERWIGLRLDCPFCGCDAVGRRRLVALRAVALALCLSGLLGLVGQLRARGAPAGDRHGIVVSALPAAPAMNAGGGR